MDLEEATQTPEEQREKRIRKWIELLSAVLLAAATIATAWSAYQSARWGGQGNSHELKAIAATANVGKFYNLAEQRHSLDVNLFGQWAAAVSTDNTKLADFALNRFPEPLKAATIAWRATDPLNNPSAPASPFNIPEYALTQWVVIDEAVLVLGALALVIGLAIMFTLPIA